MNVGRSRNLPPMRCKTCNLLSEAGSSARLTKPWMLEGAKIEGHAQKTSLTAHSQSFSYSFVTSNCRNCHDNGTTTMVRVIVTKFLSRRCNEVIKSAQMQVRFEMILNIWKPRFKIDKPTVNLLLICVYMFVCQAIHLSCTPLIEKVHVFEVKAGPIDLLPTTRQSTSQHWLEPSFTCNREEAQIICPTQHLARRRYQHPQAVCNDMEVGYRRHEFTLVSGSHEWNKCKDKKPRNLNLQYMPFVSLAPTHRIRREWYTKTDSDGPKSKGLGS